MKPKEKLAIKDLKPTQAGLRAYSSLPRLVEEVKDGKVFNDEDKSPILVARITSKFTKYVHNGHHRVVSCVLGGRDFLYPDEYEFMDWEDHSPYQEFNWDAGFITPFSLTREARLADLDPFWSAVNAAEVLYKANGHADNRIRLELEDFIRRNYWLYKCKKTVHTMQDLAILSTAGITSQITDYRVRS